MTDVTPEGAVGPGKPNVPVVEEESSAPGSVSVNSFSDGTTGSPDNSASTDADEVSNESGRLKSNEEVAQEVVAGQWGRGHIRNKKLEAAGYSVEEVLAEVAKIFNKT